MTQTLPAPLDNSKIHSPAVIRQHALDTADYYAYCRQLETDTQNAVRIAKLPKILTDEAAYQIAIAEQALKQERQLVRDVEAARQDKARQEFLISDDELIVLSANNPHTFLLDFASFTRRGYVIDNINDQLFFSHTFYSVGMRKPERVSK